MTTDFASRSALEAKTYELFSVYLNDDSKWTPQGAVIRVVFQAMWSSALPVSQIIAVGAAMSGGTVDEAVMKAELSKMVGAKVLRSRMANGRRLYEVNY